MTLSQASLDCLERLRSFSPFNDPYPDEPKKRRAAVLIALFGSRTGGLNVILTLRGANLNSHAGEVALPGGKMEDQDETIVQTALREANEEIGLPYDSDKVEYLTTFPPYFSRNKLIVTPVAVFIHDQDLTPRLNPDEVSVIFSCPFEVFLKQRSIRKKENMLEAGSQHADGFIEHESMDIVWMGYPHRMHRFSGPGLKHPVFGLTAAILVSAAKVAYGTDTEFEEEVKGHKPVSELIWHAIRTSGLWDTQQKPRM